MSVTKATHYYDDQTVIKRHRYIYAVDFACKFHVFGDGFIEPSQKGLV